MANDLRDPRWQKKQAKKSPPPSTSRSVILLIVGVILMATGFGVVIGILLLILGISGLSAAKKQAEKDGTRPAAKPVRRPAAEPAPKAEKEPAAEQRGPEIRDEPKPRRRFESKTACDNRETHSHYDTKYTPSGRVWPTDQEKRLLNMRRLYEAGLLTREEYDNEVRKLKQS